MLTIETKELEVSKDLLKKVEMICKFACAKSTFTSGSIRSTKEIKNYLLNISALSKLKRKIKK